VTESKRTGRPARRLVLAVWFVVLWVGLWGQITVANVVGGVAVAAALLILIGLPSQATASTGGGTFRPVRALVFLIYFAVQVVISNLLLAMQVIDPRNTVRPGIMRLPLHQCSDALVTLIANAITLTPGSITVEVRRFAQSGDAARDVLPGAVVYVHVLRADDPAAARVGLFRLARIAIAAFGTGAAIEALTAAEAAIAAGGNGLDLSAGRGDA